MNRYEKAAAGAVALMLLAGVAIVLAPTDWLQGLSQKIFYLHVSSAIAAFVCFAAF